MKRDEWERKGGKKPATTELKSASKPRARVLWLKKPVPLAPRSRTLVHGVMSDAKAELREQYGVGGPEQ